MYIKKFRLGPYELALLALVLLGLLIRLILIFVQWPVTNSDEAVIDLMALHIAFHGEHPIFYYGQHYMGPLEAYLGAALFRLFGASVFTLRLGLLLLFALFQTCMYMLTSMLYNKRLAIFTVALLTFGSIDMLLHELKAIGGYPETLFFGACIVMLTAWLTLSSQESSAFYQRCERLFVFGLLGFIIGLAVWTDQLILPIVATSGLLLLLFCRRDLLRWGGLFLALGFIVGAAPLLIYNLRAAPGENSLVILYNLQHSGAEELAAQHISRLREIVGAILYALPAITGANPLCPVEHLPLFGAATPDRLTCTLTQGGWAAGYGLLWLSAAILAVLALYRCWLQRRYPSPDCSTFEVRQELILQSNRLMLLIGAALTLASYTLSPQSALVPGPTSRYLICMLIATPAILWPLWRSAGIALMRQMSERRKLLPALARPLAAAALLFIAGMMVMGTIRTFQDIPTAQAAYSEQDALIRDLQRIGATHIYSDYWTCNRLIFQSQEAIICSTLKDNLQAGQDRYQPYHNVVKADPHAAYVFMTNSAPARAFVKRVSIQKKGQFQRYDFDGYVIYQPAA